MTKGVSKSLTRSDLVPCCTQALRLDTAVSNVVPHYMLMPDKVRSHAAEFDVLHFHIDHFHFPLFRHLPIPSLTTLHGRQDHRDSLPFFAKFSDMSLISISNAQRASLPHSNFAATIYHGLPQNLHEANYRPNGGYLLWFGLSQEEIPGRARLFDRPTRRHVAPGCENEDQAPPMAATPASPSSL